MNTQSTVRSDAPESMDKTNEFNRLLWIFVRPRQALRGIACRPSLFLPFAIALIASIFIGFLADRFVFTEESAVQVARASLSRNLERQGLAPNPSETEIHDRFVAIRRLQRLWPVATTAEVFIIVFGKMSRSRKRSGRSNYSAWCSGDSRTDINPRRRS